MTRDRRAWLMGVMFCGSCAAAFAVVFEQRHDPLVLISSLCAAALGGFCAAKL